MKFAFGLLVFGALGTGLASCAPPSDSPPSLGNDTTTVLWTEAPTWSTNEAWSVGSQPRLVIGEDRNEPEYLFSGLRSVRRTASGVMAVQFRPPEARFFDRDGLHTVTVGRSGDGPGEFQFIFDAWSIQPDTVALYGGNRIAYLSEDGNLLSSHQYQFVDPEGRPATYVLLGRFADGSFMALPNVTQPLHSRDELSRAPFPVMRVGARGEPTDTITVLEGPYNFRHTDASGYTAWRPVSLTPLPAVVSGDSTIYSSDTGGFIVEERSLSGTLLRRFGRPHEAEAVTRADLNELRDSRIERQRAADGPLAMEGIALDDEIRSVNRLYAEMPVPPARPVHSRFMVLDDLDNLWIPGLPEEGDTSVQWTVFDSDGRWLGLVDVPRNLRITDIGPDEVLGIWTGENDVQSIRAYPLHKP